MAVPGYSVTDLIQAVVTCKRVYDSFFSKHDNANNRVRELHSTVSLFHDNLLAHAEILERCGKHYPGFEDFERTIRECDEFLQKYRRRSSAAATGTGRGKIRAALSTAAWTFEDKNVDRLTRRLNLQIQALNSFALTVLLERLSRGDDELHLATEVIEPSETRQQLPPPDVVRENLLAGRDPLMIQARRHSSISSEDSLQALFTRATVSRNQIKRREIEALQRPRHRSHRSSADPSSARSHYQNEAREIVREWRRIAVRNGLPEGNLPQISDSQPLETAEEFLKRALQASKLASRAPLSPMPSPNLSQNDDGFPPLVGSPELRPESASLLSASPPETILSQRTTTTNATNNTMTPNSLGLLDPRRRPLSFVGSISLGLPAVLDCEAELTLRHRSATYPALEIKRIEVSQQDGACNISCTTGKGLRVVHKISRGRGNYPFTKHTCHEKPFEVSFLESHRVVHGSREYTGDPHYRFFSEEDCKLFQSSIRGKDLVLTYDVDKIAFRTSDHLGDATDQHLKVWRDFDGGHFTLTFFANNPSDSGGRRHREFRFSQLVMPPAAGGRGRPGVVRLDFRSAQSIPRRPSRTDTIRRGSVDRAVGPDSPPPQDVHRRLSSFTSRLTINTTPPRREGPDASPPTPHSPGSPQLSATARVQTISTLAAEELAASSASGHAAAHDDEIDETTIRLRFMEITFSEAPDVDRFVNLFSNVQHL